MSDFVYHCQMENLKIFRVFQVLNRKEAESIIEHFSLPYYIDKQPKMALLVKFLLKIKNNQLTTTKEEMFHAAFGNEIYDDLKFRHLCSEVTERVISILIRDKLALKKIESNLALLAWYQDNRLEKDYISLKKDIGTLIYNNKFQDIQTYWDKYNYYLFPNNFSEDRLQQNQQEQLSVASDNLDIYYMSKKLQMAAEMITLKKVSSATYDIRFIDEIINIVENTELLKNDLLRLYYFNLMNLHHTQKTEYFFSLKDLFIEIYVKLPSSEARTIYYFLLNKCAVMINSGEEIWLNHIMDLYKLGLESELIYVGKYLSIWNFKNIITTTLRLKQYDYVLQLLNTQIKNLPEEHRENAYTYNMANYYFHIKNYDKVLPLLQSVNYSELFYELDSRTLLIKTYYETHETDSLFAAIDSFSQMMRRTKRINQSRLTSYIKFIKYIKKLINAKYKRQKARIALASELRATTGVADKGWLLSKLQF